QSPSLPDPAGGRPGEGGDSGDSPPPSQIRPEGGQGRATAVATVPIPPRSGRREAGGERQRW
ncbi:Os01g0530100, partial [Oryza sativa Japonica Group]